MFGVSDSSRDKSLYMCLLGVAEDRDCLQGIHESEGKKTLMLRWLTFSCFYINQNPACLMLPNMEHMQTLCFSCHCH